MARDEGLEREVRRTLGDRPGLSEKRMFGGLAWMLHGHLLCAASDRGLMARLGPGLEEWALEVDGLSLMEMRGRSMPGWVRADRDAAAEPDLRARLLDAALAFTRTLPPKP
jgi:hypothetical protein